MAAPNRLNQPLTTRNSRDNQIEGDRQAPERAGDVGPSVFVIDVGDDGDRDTSRTINPYWRRTNLGRPPVEKFGVPGGKVTIGDNADVHRALIVSGKALALEFRADGEERKLVEFQIFLFPEKECQAQPRP